MRPSGTDFSDADQLVFEAAAIDLVGDPNVQQQATNNTPENFAVVFPKMFQDALLGRIDRDEKTVYKFLDHKDLAADLSKIYGTLVQAQAMVAYQEHCPVGELLGPDRESQHLEYKATLRIHGGTGKPFKPLETATLKTIAGFANSRDGGTLLIGVTDDGGIFGLDNDYSALAKPGKDNRDLFMLHLTGIMVASMGTAAATNATIQIHTVDGHDVCRVHVRPSVFPVDAAVTIEKKGQFEKKTAFYVRLANGTREISDPAERQKYIAGRWGNGPAPEPSTLP
ncbi:MAG: ATP-binding protein [Actinomycetota bacterium]|nr:ATP-binding protein [Actinomycetota bacterium]